MQHQMSQPNNSEELLAEVMADTAVQMLTFVINDEIYGINILKIREIVDLGKITRVPMMPDFISGVINLRGSVVPVVDLALRFSEQPSARTKRSSIVILEVKDVDQIFEIGILVDEVNEVLDIRKGDIKPAPSFGTKIRTDFVDGMCHFENNQLLIILDIDNVLSIDELSSVEMLG